jgi:MSHA biogenesis protein MshP
MFPDLIRQRGSSLVLAIFVIVLMSALLLALGRQLINSSKAVSVEVQGSRAFNAAQSGLELGLTQLFRNPANTCSAVTPSFNFNDAGLRDCTATLTCSDVANPDNAGRRLFRLVSVGQCDAGEFITSRRVVMEAY